MMKILFLLVMIMAINTNITEAQKLNYPATKKVNQVDDYFGTKVSDPYRWLEDDRAPDVEEWVKEQNKVTFSYLDKIPFRNTLRNRIQELINYPRYSSPSKEGEYYYIYKNDGLQNQSVLYRQKGLDGLPEVFLDPNKLSEDGTVSLRGIQFSKDYKYCAYTISKSGSDWVEICLMDVASKAKLTDELEWCKFTSAAWCGNGFFYSRYDAPNKSDKAFSEKNNFHKVYYHKVGEQQSADILVYQDTTKPYFHTVDISEDEDFIYLYKSGQGSGNALSFSKLDKSKSFAKLTFAPIIETMNDEFSVISNYGNKLYAYSKVDAPNGQVIVIDAENPVRGNWKVLIPQKTEPIDFANSGGDKLFIGYNKDVKSKIFVYDLQGQMENEIVLPAPGSASGFYGKKDYTEVFYSFTSFTYPSTIYRYSIKDKVSILFRKSEVKFNPDDFETEQVFYSSKDGTKIPIYIVYKKGIKKDGNNPTLLYGYGGFNVSLEPSFSAIRLAFLERGGIYAQANLRGGGEYGESWHQAGTKLNKQNVFDDFIAAAEFLIKEKYTSTPKLAIHGGSNGGLLVGAVMCQRPELFGVAIPEVGVMDMLRYQKFTIGWNWASDYGTSEDSINFNNLVKFSPVHNLKQGIKYPPTLITTADHDDRVVPAHSFKYAAALQENNSGDTPTLIRIETKSGHGSSSLSKSIETMTDIYSFIFYNMGVQIEP